MKPSSEQRAAYALAVLWSLFLYATLFSGWFDAGGHVPFATAEASSYLGD